MGDIALRGNRLTAAKGGRIGLKKGGKPWGTGPKPGSHEFMMQDIHKRKGKAIGGAIKAARILGKKFKKKKDFKTHGRDVPTMAAEGGRIGLRTGSRGPSAGERIKARKARADEWWTAKHGTGRSFHPGIDKQLREKRPHSSPEGRAHDVKKIMSKHRTDKIQADVAKFKRTAPSGRALHKEGGRIGFKKGGTDKKWMQKVSASIKKRGTKGKCTPITKPGCTGRAKALAKTFKKIAARRKA